MPATRSRVQIKVKYNPIKNVFELDMMDIRLKVTPRGVYNNNNDVIAAGKVAEELYLALKEHNKVALSYILHNLLPVIQLLS